MTAAMARPNDHGTQPHVVFLTRDPVVHQQTGSTTYAVALLQLLRSQGARVTLVVTAASSRSPRLFFPHTVETPGLTLRVPGYLRLGRWYLCPWRARAWARMAARLALRRPRLHWMAFALERLWSGALCTDAWDLTPVTGDEGALARTQVERLAPTAVLGNYCLWGPVLPSFAAEGKKTAILMHDLLSARTQRLVTAGLPLDAPPIEENAEIRWLSGAQTVLASQPAEAHAIRQKVSSRVLVTPIMLRPRALGEERVTPGRCLFIGSNILPNQNALRFLLEGVWPLVRSAVPGATLAVAGTVGAMLDELIGDAAKFGSLGLERLGRVPSLEDEYARAAVCLVPLRVGTGIKIKLLEALEHGKAIVSTSVGVEGLPAASEAISIVDEAGGFADATILLLTKPGARRQRETAALRFAEEHFGPRRALDPAFVDALLSARGVVRAPAEPNDPAPVAAL